MYDSLQLRERIGKLMDYSGFENENRLIEALNSKKINRLLA